MTKKTKKNNRKCVFILYIVLQEC